MTRGVGPTMGDTGTENAVPTGAAELKSGGEGGIRTHETTGAYALSRRAH